MFNSSQDGDDYIILEGKKQKTTRSEWLVAQGEKFLSAPP